MRNSSNESVDQRSKIKNSFHALATTMVKRSDIDGSKLDNLTIIRIILTVSYLEGLSEDVEPFSTTLAELVDSSASMSLRSLS